jgi:glycosyltransferase involved in cell wall biosynthesis
MLSKTLTLTIVIPAYNEQGYIKACLDSIKNQSVMPDEVIVVDNNSTDKTVEIANKYPFVKVIHEKRQHQVFAQAAGFNLAKGDIIGRIDADSILPPDWVSKVKEAFNNRDTIAITGGAIPYDVPLAWIGIAIFHWYNYMASLIANQRLLWGSNCAIRATAWRRIKNKVLMRPDIWEDYDLAFCLKGLGKVRYLPGVGAGVSFRAMHTSFSQHVRYQFRSVRTFYLRVNPFRLCLFILLWTTTFIIYPVAAFDDWLLKRRDTKPKRAYKA